MFRRFVVAALGSAALVSLLLWVGSGRYAASLTATHVSLFVSRGAVHFEGDGSGTGLYRRAVPTVWRLGHVGAPGWNHDLDVSWRNRRVTGVIPLWLPTAVFGALFSISWLPSRWQRHSRRRQGRCVQCGYDRSGLPTPRCPECGASGPQSLADADRIQHSHGEPAERR